MKRIITILMILIAVSVMAESASVNDKYDKADWVSIEYSWESPDTLEIYWYDDVYCDSLEIKYIDSPSFIMMTDTIFVNTIISPDINNLRATIWVGLLLSWIAITILALPRHIIARSWKYIRRFLRGLGIVVLSLIILGIVLFPIWLIGAISVWFCLVYIIPIVALIIWGLYAMGKNMEEQK